MKGSMTAGVVMDCVSSPCPPRGNKWSHPGMENAASSSFPALLDPGESLPKCQHRVGTP